VKGGPWVSFLSGRDPNPPLEPTVLLMGCKPFDAEAPPLLNPHCEVCKGHIDPGHVGYYCLCDDRADPETEVILRMARKYTRRKPQPTRQMAPGAKAGKKKTRKERRAEGFSNRRGKAK
jgi:hypothetical protein